MAVRERSSVREAAGEALRRANAHLLSLQDPAGWWKGELETNVTMDAEDLLLRQFLGIRTQDQTRRSAAWIRRSQREDGTWANFAGGPADLSTTIEAYVALRLAGDPPEAAHMTRARSFVRDRGGTRAGPGVHPDVAGPVRGLVVGRPPRAPARAILFLPPWFPLNVYDFGCWARQTIVALTVVAALRPVRPLGFSHRRAAQRCARAAGARRGARGAAGSSGLDRALRWYERHQSPATAPSRPAPGDGVDPAPPGGRRKLGRDPAAVGLVADRPAPHRATRSITR